MLRPQPGADKDVSVYNLFRDAVIILELHKLVLREFPLHAFANPEGRMPELKTVIVDNEGFHGCRYAPNRSWAWPLQQPSAPGAGGAARKSALPPVENSSRCLHVP